MKRKISFERATAQYVHRFTMDHVPEWSRKPMPNGKHYAHVEQCDCGHSWTEHVQTANGAFACRHFGCGCNNVVQP
jgi:hypothetical protein